MIPKSSMAMSFGFFLIIIILLSSSCFSLKQYQALPCNQLDHDLLFSFFLGISSSPDHNTNFNFSRNSTTDCCLWEGISCNEQGRVTHLSLPSKDLTGNLSPFLANLTHLSHLNLSHNRLSGPLSPLFFSSLNCLEILDLSTNSFTGSLPSSICLNSPVIKLLDFSFNYFTGEIPRSFGRCSELEVLRASSNSLSGVLPDDIFKATPLLREISLPANKLSGHIGDSILRLSNLTVLDIYANELTGNLPKDIGKLSNLAQLNLQLNNLTGTLPPSLVNCTNLVTLSLFHNFIEGDISAFNFSKFPRLGILDLGINRFTGNFPISLYKCKSLTAIRFSGNELKGQISPDIQALRSLSFLSLGSNGLANITRALEILMGCQSLRTSILNGNFIGEVMPDRVSINGDLVGFSNLEVLGLCCSNLIGQVPSWLVKLKKLVALDLNTNQLTGTIPGWLGTLSSLFYIDLSSNRLSGEFPKEICQLNTLMYSEEAAQKINQSNMMLSIYIMPRLPTNSIPTNSNVLQYRRSSSFPPTINLARNNLSGNIPVEIGQLRLLLVFNLSHNNFSSNIPSQISRLANLEKLDLSGNHLSGEIPVTLSGLHFLSSFNVAYNNLQGKIPSGSQLNLFESSSYVGNSELCGPPLPNACQLTTGGNGIQEEEEQEDHHEIPWFQIVVVLGYAAGFWAVCGPLVLNNSWRYAYFQFLNDMRNKVCESMSKYCKIVKESLSPKNNAVLLDLLTVYMVDMKCDGCVNAVKIKLASVDGVKNVDVDLSNQLVRILGSSPVTAMTEALEQTGRKARLIGQGVPEDFIVCTAVSEFKGPDIFGVVRMAQVNMELARIEANFSGLSPGKHGWSINEFGDGPSSSGKVFNPANKPFGDLGTLEVDEKGEAFFSGFKEQLRVADLIGRSIVLYETEEKSDLGLVASVIARSAGVGENYKKLCTCNGTTIWEATDKDFVTSKV